ncbi:transposase [Paenibacillus sp. 7541]|uniref:transposase n=1 Tax=Paenibacillus sp. 7541 TaxID=2026236 RepID=UPI001C3EF2BC|nr:transposase [Paenibacillus sp. 7541]
MKRYDKAFKEEAVRLSDEIGLQMAAEQLGVAYYTLQGWRKQRTLHGDGAHIGSGRLMYPPIRRRWKSNWREKTVSCAA